MKIIDQRLSVQEGEIRKMKRLTALILSILLLVSLTACGEPFGSSTRPGSSESSTTPGRLPGKETDAAEAPSPSSGEITVVDAIGEEGIYYPDEIIPCHYSYHVPKIQSDASGAVRINEEIMRRYAELVQDTLDTDEVPECDGISYKHYQNGDVLSLVVTYSFGMSGLMDYSVFHYDVERDKALDQDDLPGLLGVSEKTLQNAIVRVAAQKFDEAYHDLEQWEDDPSKFYRYRAETLGDYYLDNALVYLGEGEQPRVLLPFWTYAGAGVAFCDRLLALSPGGAAQVSVDFAPEGTDFEEIVCDSGEYAVRLLFTTDGPVRDFTVLRLDMEEYYDDGSILFSAEPIAMGDLFPENPVAVSLSFLGTIPNYGVSYVDGDGVLHRFALIESGYDGSILLDEADPVEEDFVLR